MDRALALRRRERVLLEAHGSAWQRPFDKEHQPRFTRGFVSDLTLSATELLDRGREYLDAAPVTRVVLRGDEDDAALVAHLGRCAFLRRVQALNLYQSPIGEEAVRTLFGLPHLAELRGLHLGEGDATPGMVAVLAECLSGLRELYLWDFHEGELGDAGLAALANHSAFAGLTALNLLQTGVGPDGARAVAESPHLHHLESLSFGFQACGYAPNYIGPEGVRCLARSPQLAGLSHLGLGLTRAGSAGVRELAASPHLGRLKSLNLGLNEIRDDGAAALAEWPGLATIAWLNLSSNDIGAAGVAALAKSPHTAKLETLGLSMNRVGTNGLRALAESPHLARLRTLWLFAHDLDESAVAVLLGDNRFAQLAELHLGGLNEPQRVRLKTHFGDRIVL
ncbi:MAG TPA: hypothetical protein VKE74_33150 [Gemmataceae bacterium]|nr:hypothetical protein [Gemmataceae bacterium]